MELRKSSKEINLNLTHTKLKKVQTRLNTRKQGIRRNCTYSSMAPETRYYRYKDIRYMDGRKIQFQDGNRVEMKDIYQAIDSAPLTRAQAKKWGRMTHPKRVQLVKKMLQKDALAIPKIEAADNPVLPMPGMQAGGKDAAVGFASPQGQGMHLEVNLEERQGKPAGRQSKVLDMPIKDTGQSKVPDMRIKDTRQSKVPDMQVKDTCAGKVPDMPIKDTGGGRAQEKSASAQETPAGVQGRLIGAQAGQESPKTAVGIQSTALLNRTAGDRLETMGRVALVGIRSFGVLVEVIDGEDPTGKAKEVAVRSAKKKIIQAAIRPGRHAIGNAAAGVRLWGREAAKKVLAAMAAAAREALVFVSPLLGLLLPVLLFLVLLAAIVALIAGGSQGSGRANVTPEVERYRPLVAQYASLYGIPEYADLILAVMMQESGGLAADVMQSSEGAFNTAYPRTPNGITDPEYSIACGVQELQYNLALAACSGPTDLPHLKLALQGYNFGSAYIRWAIERDGVYTEENAAAYSDMMCARPGWGYSIYGDKQYVPHVMRYYSIQSSTGGDAVGQQVAQLAISKVGCSYSQANRFGPTSYDCSSLVFRLYNEAGIGYLYGMTAADEAEYLVSHSMTVAQEDLQPGDVIFYGGSGNGRYMGIYHVSIYVGDGMQVDARGTAYGVVYREMAPSNINLYTRPR